MSVEMQIDFDSIVVMEIINSKTKVLARFYGEYAGRNAAMFITAYKKDKKLA